MSNVMYISTNRKKTRKCNSPCIAGKTSPLWVYPNERNCFPYWSLGPIVNNYLPLWFFFQCPCYCVWTYMVSYDFIHVFRTVFNLVIQKKTTLLSFRCQMTLFFSSFWFCRDRNLTFLALWWSMSGIGYYRRYYYWTVWLFFGRHYRTATINWKVGFE